VVADQSPDRLIWIHDWDQANALGTPYRIFSFAEGSLRGVDVVAGVLDAATPSVVALACSQDDAFCTLLGATTSAPESSTLAELDQARLPAGSSATGLVIDSSRSPALVCAFGLGIQCLGSNGWQSVIAADGGIRIRSVAVGRALSLAVGDHGRLWSCTHRPAAAKLTDRTVERSSRRRSAASWAPRNLTTWHRSGPADCAHLRRADNRSKTNTSDHRTV
jgi:hypothetical protein